MKNTKASKVSKEPKTIPLKKGRIGNPLWQKGQSGNPKGRPKSDVSFTSVLKRYLEMPDDEFKEKSRLQCLVETSYLMARCGNENLMKLIVERIDGRVLQASNVDPNAPPMPQVHIYIPDNNRPINGTN